MLRVVFMGTPDFSVPVLAKVLAAGHEIAAVYCQPPRPAGRGLAETKSPVQVFAEASGLTVYTPKTLKTLDAQVAFAALAADVAVVVAYGLILPKPILDAPQFGCLNLHASRLPRWRGAAPIQRAIMAGDTETAAMIMQMDVGLDTGPICLFQHVSIERDMTAGELHDRLSETGATLAVRALAELEQGTLPATPQSEVGVTYAAKIGKSETQIDFTRPASEVHNHIRGLSPWPGAWFEIEMSGTGKRERIKVLRASIGELQARSISIQTAALVPGTLIDDTGLVSCGDGALRLVEVQRAGKKPMLMGELLRGFALPRGTLIKRTA
jgi:methionyl-tRNA formyltransferase